MSVYGPAPAHQRPNRLYVHARRRVAAAHAVQLRHDAGARPQHRYTLDLLRISTTLTTVQQSRNSCNPQPAFRLP